MVKLLAWAAEVKRQVTVLALGGAVGGPDTEESVAPKAEAHSVMAGGDDESEPAPPVDAAASAPNASPETSELDNDNDESPDETSEVDATRDDC